MDGLSSLLKTVEFSEISVSDIARFASISQPSFYTYFSSVEDIVVALANEFTADQLAVSIEQDWAGADGPRLARELIEASLLFWNVHGPVFEVVAAYADRGRREFILVRAALLRRVYKAFEAQVAKGQVAGRISASINARLAGYECAGALTSLGRRYQLFRDSGFSHEEFVETTAHLLRSMVLGATADA
jgi:AcrR family transcriptional regulator